MDLLQAMAYMIKQPVVTLRSPLRRGGWHLTLVTAVCLSVSALWWAGVRTAGPSVAG